MQELRFVLIIVGGLAIAALLFHGLWTSRKEAKSKFGDKPLGTFNQEREELPETASRGFQSDDDLKKERKEPGFALDKDLDPLIDDYIHPDEAEDEVLEPMIIRDDLSVGIDQMPGSMAQEHPVISHRPNAESQSDSETPTDKNQESEDDYEVIVLNVHCAGAESFVGTQLFDSMQQNGLVYGEMDIYHRYADISGTGKVLFSTANILQPGSLKHDNPAEFTTKGITFFMTLPCYGDPEQNFKLMLKTAQQIADDLGGNVLDDQRSLMTPDRLGEYRRQIQLFKAKTV